MIGKEWPLFDQLTEYDSPYVDYFNGWDEGYLVPAFHWCYIAEIIAPQYHPFRPSALVKDQIGTVHPIIFYLDDQMPIFGGSQALEFKVGHTIAILYAERKTFMDLSDGIRRESDDLLTFPCSIEKLVGEIKNMSVNDCCVTCGKRDIKLSLCGKCKLSQYCGKECQLRHWKDIHRDMCRHMKLLNKVARDIKKPYKQSYSFSTMKSELGSH